MRSWIIQTLFVSVAVGWYIFYGQGFTEWVQATFNLTLESTQLYSVCALVLIVFAELFAKLLTRGMK